ncbi:hypothetical protein [Terriglobus sp.]|uniref:hypothetical protein n=1 Tax=Terriglobus sp. TaxID=1889013 RepID=UPI003B007F82
MILVISQQTAVELSTVTNFGTPDPWNGMQPAHWKLSVYRITTGGNQDLFAKYAAEKQRETVDGLNLDADDTLGLRSSAQANYHLLPRAMVRLWQQGKIPTEALPRLAAQMEPKLKRNPYAYIAPSAGRRWMRPFGWLCFAGGLFCVLAGLFNNYVRHVQDSGLVAGLIMTGIIFLACAAAFLLLGRAGGRSPRQEQQILALLWENPGLRLLVAGAGIQWPGGPWSLPSPLAEGGEPTDA